MLPSSSALAPAANLLSSFGSHTMDSSRVWVLETSDTLPQPHGIKSKEEDGQVWGLSRRQEDVGLSFRLRSVLGMVMEKWIRGVPMGDGCRELRGRTLTAPSKE